MTTDSWSRKFPCPPCPARAGHGGQGKHTKLMEVIDCLTDRLGRGKVRLDTQGLDNTWQLRSDYKSPCYITRISELYIVHVR
jgi:hypothetical protein